MLLLSGLLFSCSSSSLLFLKILCNSEFKILNPFNSHNLFSYFISMYSISKRRILENVHRCDPRTSSVHRNCDESNLPVEIFMKIWTLLACFMRWGYDMPVPPFLGLMPPTIWEWSSNSVVLTRGFSFRAYIICLVSLLVANYVNRQDHDGFSANKGILMHSVWGGVEGSVYPNPHSTPPHPTPPIVSCIYLL